jgi:hypothetical protein
LGHNTNIVSGNYPSSCFYLKHNVSETGVRLLFQAKLTQLSPVDRASPYFRTFGNISSFVFNVQDSKLLIMTKVKVQVSLHLNNYALSYEDVWGSGGIALSFLYSALDGSEWSVPCTCFTPANSAWYSLYERLNGPQSRSGRHGEQKNVPPESKTGTKNFNPSVAQPVAWPLYRLSDPDKLFLTE